MSHAERCPVCQGVGKIYTGIYASAGTQQKTCHGCSGTGWVTVPEHIGKEVEVDTGELAELLDRLEALKEAKKEYDEIDDQVKKIVEGREKILAGPWLVFGKWQERKTYDLPADLKAQYERITRFWRRSIRKAV